MLFTSGVLAAPGREVPVIKISFLLYPGRELQMMKTTRSRRVRALPRRGVCADVFLPLRHAAVLGTAAMADNAHDGAHHGFPKRFP